MESNLLTDLALQSLLILVIISFLLERGLAIFFEMDWLNPPEMEMSKKDEFSLVVKKSWASKAAETINGIKVIIAFALAYSICWYYDFDVISAILEPGVTTIYGQVITAAVIAGGSQASIKLFQDILGFSKIARAARSNIRKENAAADLAEAKARKAIADNQIAAAAAVVSDISCDNTLKK